VDNRQRPRSKNALDDTAKPRGTWLIYAALAVLGFLFISRMSSPGTPVSYDELKAKVRADQIQSVVIGATEVRAEAKGEKNRTVFVTGRGSGPDLEHLLDEAKIKYTYETGGSVWTAIVPWVVLFGGMVVFWGFILKRMKPGAGMMQIGKSKAKLVGETTGTTFADVAGVDEAVDELREIVDFLASPEKFRRLGGKIPKGVLLVGPPGTGKTLLARAVAGEAKVPFFQLTGSDFVEMFVGVGAARVRDLFEQAQAKAPCIIFIDELDAIGKARGVGVMAGHDEREQTLNQLLAEMDGFDPTQGLIIVAATNRPEILDPALLRPGRFDRQVVVDRPDIRGREAILRVHAKEVRLGPGVDLKRMAALTPGFAGAELANVINEAALLAARFGKSEVSMQELSEAVERVMAGLQKKNRVLSDRERHIVAHHEGGHALLAEVLPTTDRVHKVSIIPRGTGALGYTMQLPLEEHFIVQRPELLDKITVLFGGRAAELIMFGEVSTGAADDLERATELARRMIVQYGMSKTLGPQAYAHSQQESRFLPGVVVQSNERVYSERTAEAVDEEVTDLLNRLESRAVAVLAHNRRYLEELAQTLLADEVLEGDRLRTILQGASLPAEAAEAEGTRPSAPSRVH
jgi:cell division protease FtsH